MEGCDSNCSLCVIFEGMEWLALDFTADEHSSIHEKREKFYITTEDKTALLFLEGNLKSLLRQTLSYILLALV